MSLTPCSPIEQQILTHYRALREHQEFTLTITGFLRSGKRQVALKPQPVIYVMEESVGLAVDD